MTETWRLELFTPSERGLRLAGEEAHQQEREVDGSFVLHTTLSFGTEGESFEASRTRFAVSAPPEFNLLDGSYRLADAGHEIIGSVVPDGGGWTVSLGGATRWLARPTLPLIPSYVLAQLPVLLHRNAIPEFECILYDEGAGTATRNVRLLRREADEQPAAVTLSAPAATVWSQVDKSGAILVDSWLSADGQLLANDYRGAWAVLPAGSA